MRIGLAWLIVLGCSAQPVIRPTRPVAPVAKPRDPIAALPLERRCELAQFLVDKTARERIPPGNISVFAILEDGSRLIQRDERCETTTRGRVGWDLREATHYEMGFSFRALRDAWAVKGYLIEVPKESMVLLLEHASEGPGRPPDLELTIGLDADGHWR